MAKSTVGGVDRLAAISSVLSWVCGGILLAGDLDGQWASILITIIVGAVVLASYISRR